MNSTFAPAAVAAGGLETLLAPPYDLVPPNIAYPFYHAGRTQVLSWISDKDLSLAIPVVVYWVVSLVFHVIDISEIPYFEKHRIHEPEEIKKRNRVTVKTVLLAVVCQHVIQTALGMYWIDASEGVHQASRDHREALQTYAAWISRIAFAVLGPKAGNKALRSYGAEVTSWISTLR